MKYRFTPSLLIYTGGKFRLLSQIIQLLPEKIPNFVEPFCGSAVVSLNITSNSILCNDKCTPIIQLYQYLQQANIEKVIDHLYAQKTAFRLTQFDADAYHKFRDYYNTTKHELDFLLLCYHSFNNNLHFGKDYKFTAPFGERTFTTRHEKRLRYFTQTIVTQSWKFSCHDFRELDTSTWDDTYVVYIDSPYSNSHASYMDYIGWTQQDDLDLFDWVDKLHAKGVKFALSNTLINKGVKNIFIEQWAVKYNVYAIDSNYSGASYHRKDRQKANTVEILVTNYNPSRQPFQESFL